MTFFKTLAQYSNFSLFLGYLLQEGCLAYCSISKYSKHVSSHCNLPGWLQPTALWLHRIGAASNAETETVRSPGVTSCSFWCMRSCKCIKWHGFLKNIPEEQKFCAHPHDLHLYFKSFVLFLQSVNFLQCQSPEAEITELEQGSFLSRMHSKLTRKHQNKNYPNIAEEHTTQYSLCVCLLTLQICWSPLPEYNRTPVACNLNQ